MKNAALSELAVAVLAGAGIAATASLGLGRLRFDRLFHVILLLPRSGLTPYGLRTMVRNQAKKSDTIGGIAKAAGVSVETVRYYQRRGLLSEPSRPPGEIRRYSDEDLKRLRFIRSAQAAGFTLTEIGELLELDASDDRMRAQELAQARVSALDQKIAELREAREALMGLATACASRRKGPCPILSAFEPAEA